MQSRFWVLNILNRHVDKNSLWLQADTDLSENPQRMLISRNTKYNYLSKVENIKTG